MGNEDARTVVSRYTDPATEPDYVLPPDNGPDERELPAERRAARRHRHTAHQPLPWHMLPMAVLVATAALWLLTRLF